MGTAMKEIEKKIQNFFKDDSKIRFVGLPQEEQSNELINALADKIQNQSPSDAIVTFEIERDDDFYTGKCNIKSKALYLEIEALARTPLQTMQALYRKTRVQLDLWKRKRRFN